MLGVLVAMSALVAGCGGGGGAKPLTKAQYTAQVKKIGTGLSASLSALTTVTTKAQAVTALKKAQTDVTSAASQLDAITPPADVTTQQAALSKGVHDLADELGALTTKVQSTGLSALSAEPKGITEIQTAAAAIIKAGYKISG